MFNLAARVDINITLYTNIQKLLQRLKLEHLYFAADDIIMTQCRQRSFFKKSEFIFMISTLKNPTLLFSTASIWIFGFRCRWHHYDATSSATICQRIWVHIHDQHPKKPHTSLFNRLNDSICILLPMTSSWRNVVSKLSYSKMDLRFTLSALENPWIQFSGISEQKKIWPLIYPVYSFSWLDPRTLVSLQLIGYW